MEKPEMYTGSEGGPTAEQLREVMRAFPDEVPADMPSLAYGVVPSHHFIDEMAFRDYSLRDLERMPPVVAFDVERTLDGEKVADHVRKVMASDTYGKFKPVIVVDSCPPELFGGSRRSALMDPDPVQPEIDPNPKRKPPPSGLLMRLMSRL